MQQFKRSNNKISKTGKKNISCCNRNPEGHEDHKLLICLTESDNISIDPHLLDRLFLLDLSVKPPPQCTSKKEDIKVNVLGLCAFFNIWLVL